MAIEPEAAEATGGQELLERVEQLTAAIDAAADPFVRGTVDELVTAIIELYGEGLARIVDLVSEDEALLRALAQDSVIGSLLLIHDLYPVPLETRVQEALASVRPYMESHGGDVELLRLEDGIAHLRLVGHCHGCPASAATLELAIKEAIDDAAPDLLGLEVEGVAEPKPVRKPLAMVGRRRPPAHPTGSASSRRRRSRPGRSARSTSTESSWWSRTSTGASSPIATAALYATRRYARPSSQERS